MAGDKYIEIDVNGDLNEVASTDTSAGAGDAGKVVALNASGEIDSTMLPESSAIDMVAGEALDAGDFVNVYFDSGRKVRKADASNGRECHGFVKASVLLSASGTVYGEGRNSNVGEVGSSDHGKTVFLSNSAAGAGTVTPVTTSGHILQKVGYVNDDGEVEFERGEPITRA